MQASNQGCFLLMVGIYFFSKGSQFFMPGDDQSGLKYYLEAYKIFQTLQDSLFMLLTSRLIIEVLRSKGYGKENYKDYQAVYDSVSRLPEFKEVNLELLFENFEQRLDLAREITRGLHNVEAAFRDDQFKSGTSPGRDGGGMDAANSEVNLVWKQAVRLSLKRSINSARLIISNDRDLSNQKKSQLINVNFNDCSLQARFRQF